MSKKPNIVFFGGEPLGLPSLQKLHESDLTPKLVVCSPDRPAGRGMKLSAPPIKQWSKEHDILVLQPGTYRDDYMREKLLESDWDIFVVVAYNFILPKWLLELPKFGCVNLHPSLLPALRGPSPIRTAILQNEPENIGISIMLLDEKMDHGPLLAQSAHTPAVWPVSGIELDETLTKLGAELLVKTIPKWLAGEIEPIEQNHNAATYTSLFKKGENEISLSPHTLPVDEDAVRTLHKIYAWQGIGDTYFLHNNKRIKIKDAGLSADGTLELYSVIPEGKQMMPFKTFLESLSSPR